MAPNRETIRFSQPVRQVRLAAPPVAWEVELRIREREQAAFERGRRAGEQALSEQLLRQRGELLEVQNGLFASLRQVVPTVVRQCEEDLIALATELAGKVVSGIPVTREMVEGVVREALDHVEHHGDLTVLLHPDDLDLLEKINSPLLREELGGERLAFRASPDVTRGGCLVQTRFGIVDARRETKLEALAQSMEGTCN